MIFATMLWRLFCSVSVADVDPAFGDEEEEDGCGDVGFDGASSEGTGHSVKDSECDGVLFLNTESALAMRDVFCG